MEKTKVLRNKRVGEKFSESYFCSYCTNYNSQIINIPDTDKYICKGCLTKLIKKLDDNMINNYKRDFDMRHEVTC